ncbi:MAG TPA: enolase C-terminal domain-like protein [Actinomycetota bacterium]|jgi:L-alanine-DL-glutamate epimerase-like enolase superfamily enzyme|nr:enolase C-terminal domain-like protein [Actinomycetota bacterium]
MAPWSEETAGPPVAGIDARAYQVPTEQPESDGTLAWDSVTIVVVHAGAGGSQGVGYTYADPSLAPLINDKLAGVVRDAPAFDVPAISRRLYGEIRNLGRPGLCAEAISAVDVALWDLKARLLDLPLAALLGRARDACPIYGSGGFTSYTTEQLAAQLAGWVHGGIPRVKLKVGRDPGADPRRVETARDAIGPDAGLFVDANGAYSRKQALQLAAVFAEQGVSWFEEPVSSDDLEGLRLLRDRAPAGMEVAAGEYAFDLFTFRRMLDAESVDVIQPDATRCGGVTGFLKAATLAETHGVPVSAHCAPSLHAHVGCAVAGLRHIEYFHDHVRIEHLLFDGVREPDGGSLRPDMTRPGLGLELKRADAERYLVA